MARVAELLGVEVRDLPPLLAGTVQAPPGGMARVRRELEAAADVPF